jgi:prephenate dehydrogenase
MWVDNQLVISCVGLMSKMSEMMVRGSLVCVHRMSGNDISAYGFPLICSRVRVDREHEQFVEMFCGLGQWDLILSTPEKHDHMVGLTQKLIRLTLFEFTKSICSHGDLGDFSNLPYMGIIHVIARVFSFGPEMFIDMVNENDSIPGSLEEGEVREVFDNFTSFMGGEAQLRAASEYFARAFKSV